MASCTVKSPPRRIRNTIYPLIILGVTSCNAFRSELLFRLTRRTSSVTISADSPVDVFSDRVPSKVPLGAAQMNNAVQYRKISSPFNQTVDGVVGSEGNGVEEGSIGSIEIEERVVEGDVTTESLAFDGTAVLNAVNDVTKPLVSPEIQHDVNTKLIQGAALAGASLALLTTKTLVSVPVASLASAYVSIHPGRAGDVARSIGEMAYNVGSSALSATEALSHFVGRRGGEDVELSSRVDDVMVDEDMQKVLADVKEAEMMVDEVKKVNERRSGVSGVVSLQAVEISESVSGLEMAMAELDEVDECEESEEIVDWSQMTVKMLRDELRHRDLKVSGRKAELIQRLEDYTL
mmetsp:Transcript_25671/g.31039  ORF Transcript_25671/g.31039 Transcript_25671/m.31039 type:complete len:349 (+) Transcript_25671:51-1097(+)